MRTGLTITEHIRAGIVSTKVSGANINSNTKSTTVKTRKLLGVTGLACGVTKYTCQQIRGEKTSIQTGTRITSRPNSRPAAMATAQERKGQVVLEG